VEGGEEKEGYRDGAVGKGRREVGRERLLHHIFVFTSYMKCGIKKTDGDWSVGDSVVLDVGVRCR